MNDEPNQMLAPRDKKRPFTRWAMSIALLGAGAAPCPDCGMPLAVHLWPLALLLAVMRLVTRRTRPRPADQTTPEQPPEPNTER
jgi:hypothetical protein